MTRTCAGPQGERDGVRQFAARREESSALSLLPTHPRAFVPPPSKKPIAELLTPHYFARPFAQRRVRLEA